MGARPPGTGAERVGCMGRRSPGRNGGRAPGAPAAPGAPGAPAGWPGRGRWKMGWPRTGPGRVPAGADAEGPCGGREGWTGGAVYTGRGPVCGTIMRRAGCSAGAAGCRDAGGCVVAGASGALAGGAASRTGGAETGASTTGSATATGGEETSAGEVGAKDASGGAKAGASGGGAAGAASATTAGGGATAAGGRSGGRRCATLSGVTIRGARSGAVGAAGGVGGATVRAAGGRVTIARGGGGAAGVSTASLRARMAFSASPGLEIFERSIFGRNSSPPGRVRLAAAPPPLISRTYLRTRSASSSSTELEWVFFSVTPTFARTSRISLLFTSSSRARSLIRIFIRPLLPYSACVSTDDYCLAGSAPGSSECSCSSTGGVALSPSAVPSTVSAAAT